jgi:methionyl aminopeptidase
MTVTIKTPKQQEKMRVASRLAADVLDMIEDYVKPGMTTDELNQICHDFMIGEQDAIPAPLNYRGFPKSICTSVNNVVCHGIPGDKTLKSGDAINIDITVIKHGFHGDTSRMFMVGKENILASRLATVAREAMWLGIQELAPGKRLGDIGEAIQKHVESHRYSVVREYCGHGIGQMFHEDPQVLHYGKRDTGMELQEGMTLTIEPMVNAGKAGVRLLPDGWTVVTKDRSLSAQWEHTCLITADGFEVLTLGAAERP